MSLRALLAAAAVVSLPIAVQGAEPPASQRQKAKDQTKRTCNVRAEIGSRIKTVRTCRTAAETEALRQEHRRTIDRVQTNKVSFGS